MTIKNWWIETRSDGKDWVKRSGPPERDGGFRTVTWQRSKGKAEIVLVVEGKASGDDLILKITRGAEEEVIGYVVTSR